MVPQLPPLSDLVEIADRAPGIIFAICAAMVVYQLGLAFTRALGRAFDIIFVNYALKATGQRPKQAPAASSSTEDPPAPPSSISLFLTPATPAAPAEESPKLSTASGQKSSAGSIDPPPLSMRARRVSMDAALGIFLLALCAIFVTLAGTIYPFKRT